MRLYVTQIRDLGTGMLPIPNRISLIIMKSCGPGRIDIINYIISGLGREPMASTHILLTKLRVVFLHDDPLPDVPACVK